MQDNFNTLPFIPAFNLTKKGFSENNGLLNIFPSVSNDWHHFTNLTSFRMGSVYPKEQNSYQFYFVFRYLYCLNFKPIDITVLIENTANKN